MQGVESLPPINSFKSGPGLFLSASSDPNGPIRREPPNFTSPSLRPPDDWSQVAEEAEEWEGLCSMRNSWKSRVKSLGDPPFWGRNKDRTNVRLDQRQRSVCTSWSIDTVVLRPSRSALPYCVFDVVFFPGSP